MPKKYIFKKPKNWILRVCVLVFVAYAAIVLMDMQLSVATRRSELSDLQDRISSQSMANRELERQLERGVDSAYIERIARERLDFIMPNEEVYIDISGN